MGKRSNAKKAKLLRLLAEYLKDSNRSDGQVAKVLGVSQPTVSKMKNELLEEGLVSQFSAIPDLAKVGYEIMAFSFIKFNVEQVSQFDKTGPMKMEERAKEWASGDSRILFDARAEGMGIDAINISFHKDYASYQRFLADNKKKWGNMLADVQYVLVDLVGGVVKPFSFKYLAENR